MAATCWDVLGLTEARRNGTTTEKDVKRAYRSMARMTHPDRYQKAEDKEQATEIFRQVYEAYEEALWLVQNPPQSCWRNQHDRHRNKYYDSAPSSSSSSSRHAHSKYNSKTEPQHRATHDFMRQAFEKVCKELDEELQFHRAEDAIRTAQQINSVWPDEERAWAIFRSSTAFLSSLRPHLNEHAHFSLSQRFQAKVQHGQVEEVARSVQLLQFLQCHRNYDQRWLFQEISQRWMLSDVSKAMKTCHEPMIQRQLQLYRTQALQRSEQRLDVHLQETAQIIQQVHPDIPAMKHALKQITFRSHRKRVLEYLPTEMRYLAGVAMVDGGCNSNSTPNKRLKLGK
mmetsp:Transcript_5011/g.14600  ORF Transcript_5011/g.14600 Transcript_5011/m.14600 type:complete len:341 (+) Transcript_5011:330-1352(+)